MNATNHRDLIAWQEGINLVILSYRETDGFPRDELYGLTSQIRKSAASVPANIAEGAEGIRLENCSSLSGTPAAPGQSSTPISK